MDEERAHHYEDLKAALLTKFDISPETYRQKFWSNTVPPGESPTETYYRLKGPYRCWIRPEQHTKEEIGEAIILEQLIRVLPGDVRTWVPLDLLRKGWESPASAPNDKGMVQFVLEMRDRLGRYREEAEVNLRDAQRSQKTWSPDFRKKFLVQVDASTIRLGAVLAQGDPGEEHPVLYLSHKLLPRETNYSTVEKEALAIKWALEKCRYYLLGKEFELETDHRALT
ncbi:unnamed protein product [Oreochromis niloticus]|nr:unnamed protein product [Mustela putorius furo]